MLLLLMVVGVLLVVGVGWWYGKLKVLVDGWLDIVVGVLCDGGCNDVILVLGVVEVLVLVGVIVIIVLDW